MRTVFGSKRDPWEELYDFDTNTYFYRHRGTGEFSRTNPSLLSNESKSSHVPSRAPEPLWETQFDSQTNPYWTDLETGRVCFTRPETGTFVTETPLRDFRKAATKIKNKDSRTKSSRQSTATRQSVARKSMRVVRRDDDFGIVTANQGDLDFENMFGNASPAQFDAAALFLGGTTASSSSVATQNTMSPKKSTRRSSTKDEPQEEFDDQSDGSQGKSGFVLDEETVLSQSTIVTDNPLFQYGK